jgi:8-oxo-dGTP diphosphatase
VGSCFDEQAAVREVEEETGMRCRLEEELAPIRYRDSRGRDKVVRYWRMQVLGGSFSPTSEIDELRWLGIEEAGGLLSYEHDRALLRSVVDDLDI